MYVHYIYRIYIIYIYIHTDLHNIYIYLHTYIFYLCIYIYICIWPIHPIHPASIHGSELHFTLDISGYTNIDLDRLGPSDVPLSSHLSDNPFLRSWWWMDAGVVRYYANFRAQEIAKLEVAAYTVAAIQLLCALGKKIHRPEMGHGLLRYVLTRFPTWVQPNPHIDP